MENSIKVGYDSKTNLYTFKSPSSHLAKNLCVNGKPIADPLLGQKVGELMIPILKFVLRFRLMIIKK
jgi:hypothetical protein